jgi:hypothetical protein
MWQLRRLLKCHWRQLMIAALYQRVSGTAAVLKDTIQIKGQ